MEEKIEKEIDAIKAILGALEPLDEETRNNVLEYVLKKINKSIADFIYSKPQRTDETSASSKETPSDSSELHIKDFRETKSPKTGLEMAAVVAFYLEHLAPSDQRKDRFNASDMETWFRIADYKLPNVQFLLPNAKNAGYFDSVGGGEYRLNTVGYNLVKHSLPRKPGSTVVRKRKTPKKKRVNRK